MKDPTRLVQQDANDVEARLLNAGIQDEPPEHSVKRAAAILGLSAGAVLTSSQAAAVSSNSKLWGALKWIGIGGSGAGAVGLIVAHLLSGMGTTTGLLIPPSNIMIVYAVVAGNVSVAALFVAGIVPGIVMGLLIMAVCFFGYRKAHVVGLSDVSPARMLTSLGRAAPSLLLIVLVLGGILSGVFSATEASAVAVAYALLLSVVVYRELRVRDLPRVVLKAAKTTSVVMLLVGASQAMSWVLALEQVPQAVSQAMLSLSGNTIVTLLVINLLLLMVGTFMDMTPAILIFTPIFLPVVTKLGLNPVHFGIVLITNLCISLCTPPVGTCLFMGCSVGGTTIARVVRPLLPIFVAMLVALLLITYVPGLSLWLPRLFNL